MSGESTSGDGSLARSRNVLCWYGWRLFLRDPWPPVRVARTPLLPTLRWELIVGPVSWQRWSGPMQVRLRHDG